MNWSKEKISSFAQVTTGGTPSTDNREYWDGGNIPWINSGDLNQGVVTRASNFITHEGYKNSSTKLMPPNTVLIALTGATTGLSAILKIEACANQSVTGILPSEKHHPEFLYYYFRTQRQRIMDAAWGGAQPHINQKYVKDYEVPLPPLAEQIKIATVLNKAEALIKQRKENIDLLDDFLKSIFVKMFGDIQNSQMKSVKDIASKERYALSSGPFGSNLTSEHYVDRGVIILRGTNISSGELDLSNIKYVSEEKARELERSEIKPDDLVIVAVGSSGKALKIPKSLPRAIISQNFNKITPDQSIANPTFLEYCFNSEITQKQLKRLTTDAGRTFLSLTNIKELEIPVPPLTLQNEFAEIVEKVKTLKEKFREVLNDSINLFGSLSQKGFKGELDLSAVEIDQRLLITDTPHLHDKPDVHLREIKNALAVAAKISKQFEKVSDLAKEATNFTKHFEAWEKINKSLTNIHQVPSTLMRAQENMLRIQKALSAVTTVTKLKSPGKITWDRVSSEQFANWIKESFTGFYFTSEMLINFLTEEHVTFPDYYSSEELKKNPKANDADDFKSFIFAALNNQNPFLGLEQVFYNGELDNINLTLRPEDFELIKAKSKAERTGVYLQSVE